MTDIGVAESRSAGGDIFDPVRAVADAILYEGYLLYPYRRSSAKNRLRWQFGVLAPRGWIEAQRIPDAGVAGAAESWFQQAECLLEAPDDARLEIRVRYLQQQRRQVMARLADGSEEPVDELEVAGVRHLTYDEARPCEHGIAVDLHAALGCEQSVQLSSPAAVDREPVGDAAELVRTTAALQAVATVSARRCRAPFPLVRLRVRVENALDGAIADASRSDVLPASLIASHLLIRTSAGHFLSLQDPPVWASAAAAECCNQHVFPVLAGSADTVLCAPIILPDHPQVAPESPGDLHDAAEIDEILSLRTLTLTDDEKREARGTDPRAAAIIDRVDTMPPEVLARLHGAVRSLRPVRPSGTEAEADSDAEQKRWWEPGADADIDPETDSVLVNGVPVSRGCAVRLRPSPRGTDVHDVFLAGRTARVQAVLRDVDGSTYVAVTVDDDPGADLHEWYGRHLHFSPDELEPA